MNLLALLLEEREDTGPLIDDQTSILLAVVGGAVLLVVLVFAFVVWLPRFPRELRHLNMRIQQSVSERERQHYIRRRRSLLWSIIPFVKYKNR